jgi:signal transduction histidine kinase
VVAASAPTEASATHAGDGDHAAYFALAIGLAFSLAYLLIPADLHVRNLVIYPGVELAAILAIVLGVRRFRPEAPQAWLLIAAGFSAYWVGDVIWGVYELQDRDPFPSPADFFYLAGYPLVGAGLAIAVWRLRRVGLDRAALLDAASLSVVAALLWWIYNIEPVLDDPELSTFEAAMTIAYPVGDLILLALAARFVMGWRWNVRSLRMLVLGLAFTLVGDLLFALGVLGEGFDEKVGDTALLVGVVLCGSAALDPTMRALTQPGKPARPHDIARLVFVVALALVPGVVLLVRAIRGESLYIAATVVAMLCLTGLAVARFDYAAGRARRAAARETTLSHYAAELLSATDEDLRIIAERTANELLTGGGARLVIPADGDAPPADHHQLRFPVLVRGDTVAELVADAEPTLLNRAHDSLMTVAAQLALALEREDLLATEREAADKLTEQNAKLRELDRMKDQFVSSVTHELRTPLTSMVGYLEIIRDGEAGELSDDQTRFLEIVDRNCHRLNDLIDDILLTARLDSGRFSLERQPVDLVALAEQQVESMRATAEAADVDLRLTVGQHPPDLCADPMRLGQMLDNLLSNATKFTPAGGHVTVTVDRRGDDAHIEVADTGVGIPEDEVGRLFERFYRASTATAVKGTGLGLSITKAIVEAHGGTISVRSKVGTGSTFSVDLPLPAVDSECETASVGTEVHQ